MSRVSKSPSGERLTPARPDGGTTAHYGPKVPWALILGVLSAGVVAVFAWQWQSHARLANMKASLLSAHDKLSSATDHYNAFDERLDSLIRQSLKREPPGGHVDPGLRLSELHQAEGLYLRLPSSATTEPDSYREAAVQTEKRGLPRCLGIGPLSLRSFFESGEFLGERFRARVEEAEDDLIVRSISRELERDASQHVATVTSALRADYLLVALERGGDDGPVDVFLWRLRTNGDRLVLSTRTQPDGMLIPARIALGGIVPPRHPPIRESVIADDCSIAAQVKQAASKR